MKAGAADYMPKARLSPDGLARSLRNILRVRRAETVAAQTEAERRNFFERLAAEQGQMEAVLSSMTEGLVVSDLEGNVLTMNPAALALFGFTEADQIKMPLHQFAGILELFYPDGVLMPLEEWPLSRALRGETFSNFEVGVRQRASGKFWVGSFGGTPVRSKTGEEILAVVTVRDITAIKKVQEQAAFLAEAGARLSATLDTQNNPGYSRASGSAIPDRLVRDQCSGG